MRRIILAGLALGCVAWSVGAQAAGLSVAMDEVRTITFPTAVATVYVGNPAIADINMIDARHAFVIGKGYGSTNILALDRDGRQIANTRVAVMAGKSGGTLVLNRGAERITYSCSASHCEAVPQPGDGKDAFEQASGQLAAHSDNARKAAGP